MTGIVKRMLDEANASEELNPGDSAVIAMREAAGVIEELLAALKPFSDAARYFDRGSKVMPDDTGLWIPTASHGPPPPAILARDVRRARAILAEANGEPK